MAETTAAAMARGGIYDQLAGGFARYSVDADWVVPHFEKMLYDNALLARVYAHLSPSEVESLATVPLEAALQGVPGVNDIRSDSEPQLSAIFLYFNAGTDELHARQLVQERLQTDRAHAADAGATRRRCTRSCRRPAGSCRSA